MRRECVRWGWASLGLAISILGGCNNDSDTPPAASLSQSGSAIPALEQQAKDPCADPTSTDCPCVQEGSQIDCGSVHEMRGDYVICSLGVRTCSGGLWSECEAQQLTVEQAAAQKTTTDGLRLMALSAGANCNNLCDPQCIAMSDTGTGLTVSDDLQADSDGLTLPKVGSGGHCSSLTISPASATINISAISTTGVITASPASVAFSATCSTGVPVQPSWTIDSYDRAQINASGTLTPFSGIGSSILVTATSSQDAKTALVSVITSIATTTGTQPSTTIVNGLKGTSFSTDAGKTLYPYNNTVFPLDLKAPLVQWDDGGKASSGTMLALRYIKAGVTMFWYSNIRAADPTTDSTLHPGVPSWQIPQEIWSAFDRSATGDPLGADIIIRRYYSSAAHEMKIHVVFATQPLYGSVYYTQYKRNFMPTSACLNQASLVPASYVPGNYCPVGNCTNLLGTLGASTTRTIDLSKKTAPNTDPFNGANVYCPVCHSVSANGGVHVAGDQAWVQQPTGSQLPMPGHSVNSITVTSSGDPFFSPLGNSVAPTYTGLSDSGISNAAGDPYADYERTGENSRGFAYGALSPDGSLVMQGPTFWGSGQDTPSTNNTQNAVLNGLGGSLKPFFLLKTAQPGLGVQFATTAALPSNTWSSGVFSGSSGALTVDGFTLNAVNQSVLVKDETTKNRNGVYVLSQVNPWKLSRRYDANSGSGTSNVMAGGMDVRVTDGNANVGKVFYISSPSSGTITYSSGAASSALTFTERLMPGQYGSSGFTVDYATTAALPAHTQNTSAPATLTASANGPLTIDGVTMPVGAAILVKDESTQSHNGIYTVTVKGSSTAPTAAWKLTRRSDADANNELHGQQEVKVTSGSYNAGRVFSISSPASGGISVNAAIAFTETSLPAMLTPTISPNGSKIAYVNADADTTYGLADGGWRRTLTMMSFDQSAYTAGTGGTVFSNKTRLLNNWSSGSTGVPIKWPFFEGDSRSLIFVQTEATDFCSSTDTTHSFSLTPTDTSRACFDGGYGSMSPTARGRWKGSLWAVDTQNTANIAELANLNNAEDPTDADHAYQPTVLPISVGGYRWVIFSSNRSYGNQFNYRGPTGTPTHFTCSASMLWIAALNDVTAGATDRSHPAFLLPGQNMASITAGAHYINERGYLVPSPCKNSGASCSSDEECCGSGATPATAACRAPTTWTPASGTPAKTCAALSGTCSNTGGTCATPADCCNATDCINFACAAPPSYTEATFDRDYTATCATGYQPNWQLFSYYLTTGNGSSIAFTAKTAATAAALTTASSLTIGTSTATVVSPATPAFFDVGAVLNTNHVNGRNYLRITVDLIPSTDGQTAPVLHDWEMRYTCVAAQ